MKKKIKILSAILAISILTNLYFLVVFALNINISKYLNQTETNNDTSFFMQRNKYFESLPAKEGSIVFLGDSYFQNLEIQEQLGNINILNRGIIGDDTKGILYRLNETIDNQPSKIFLMIGVNDLLHGIKMNETVKNYHEIISLLKSKCPNSEIYVHTLFPADRNLFIKNQSVFSFIQPLNNEIRKMCSIHQVDCIDLYEHFLDENGNINQKYYMEDKLHLNGKGYVFWIDQLIPYLQ